ncbi:hypothetical protein LEP1GSC103_0346 [Leptospira borgpetersenii serovar Javanica str. UI 09931]|uniref:Uncharacterized protein n=1 Tax=Leptospira borgpetersenii serovar Javanica str. UI 09931 TaxID=1049767 RepID=A0AAV3JFD8_LEPBO|nr:hypothetical protein C4Q31_05425 [Leptospira borgpetersenii serovar Ceylonica]EKQ92643.1 hypothetical protein LEP1GSC101_2748 [Leptospira borgpetersenii str. UI 09149]EKQ99467.1 hypothetical protein LEP1GSC121_2042 [Leptospira borgpetersenii serovar Castellonis str. 200801910]EMN57999.1 hypothetical protein LEP1GSC090_3793 [Leptospira borgpetersenii serovar Javanica str. MK146]EPG58813.1 hypothetical protein LEP1GSC103_0346 [Leptospira borgpetersenii serovar Javanica str. UI 09931]KGE25590.
MKTNSDNSALKRCIYTKTITGKFSRFSERVFIFFLFLKVTTRKHDKNTLISLFQKLECWIFFKKAGNSGFGPIL